MKWLILAKEVRDKVIGWVRKPEGAALPPGLDSIAAASEALQLISQFGQDDQGRLKVYQVWALGIDKDGLEKTVVAGEVYPTREAAMEAAKTYKMYFQGKHLQHIMTMGIGTLALCVGDTKDGKTDPKEDEEIKEGKWKFDLLEVD